MSGLTKEQILGYRRNRVAPVEAFGGTVYVRTITIKERETWEQIVTTPTTKTKARATFLSYALCDEAGNKLFTPEDLGALMSMEFSDDIDRVFLEANKLNKTTAEDLTQAEKNCSTNLN